MNKNRYRYLVKSIRTVDFKCNKILRVLEVMRSESKDTMLDSIKDSARDMFLSSLKERRRIEGHD